MTAELAVVAVVIVTTNVWVHVGPRRTHLMTGPLGALVLLVAGRVAGLSWTQLGLGPGTLLPGVVVGLVGAAAIAAGLAVGFALPRTRAAFLDTRYDTDTRAAVRTALITIPLSTVVFEESAFRGVVWGFLDKDGGVTRATIVSSALFGLWHVLPAVEVARTSTALRGSGSDVRRRTALAVCSTVVGTALAGLVLAGLRSFSGSLLAPVLVHWAANGCAVVAASLAWARRRDREGVTRPG